MSAIVAKQFCSKYYNTFNCHPKPTQLISFAKKNGVKLKYVNVRKAIQTYLSNPVSLQPIQTMEKQLNHKDKMKKEVIKNKNEQTTQQKIFPTKTMNKIPTALSLIDFLLTSFESKSHTNNTTKLSTEVDINVQHSTEHASHNKTKATKNIKDHQIPNNDEKKEQKDATVDKPEKYEIILRRKHQNNIKIEITKCLYTFKDWKDDLKKYHNVLIRSGWHTKKGIKKYWNDNDNMILRFSPICHKMIIDLRVNNSTYYFVGAPKYRYDERLSSLPLCNRITIPMPIKQRNVYHSRFNFGYKYNDINPGDYKVVCGVVMLPLKEKSIPGIAECTINENRFDIVDDALEYFRGNILFSSFTILGEADLVLVYLTAFIAHCVRELKNVKNKNDAISKYLNRIGNSKQFLHPGQPKFPFYRLGRIQQIVFKKPTNKMEQHVFIEYFKQIRYETLKRLIEKCYFENGTQHKHWFQFSKRRFLGVDRL